MAYGDEPKCGTRMIWTAAAVASGVFLFLGCILLLVGAAKGDCCQEKRYICEAREEHCEAGSYHSRCDDGGCDCWEPCGGRVLLLVLGCILAFASGPVLCSSCCGIYACCCCEPDRDRMQVSTITVGSPQNVGQPQTLGQAVGVPAYGGYVAQGNPQGTVTVGTVVQPPPAPSKPGREID